jgi:transcriptional regulator with XRE-family HTH domain
MPKPPKTDERPSRAHKKSPRYRRETRALGLRIRRIREAQGWTLEQAAERCDVDLKHLQKIEAGLLNVTLVTLVRLSAGLRQPIAVLFGGIITEPAMTRERR